MTGGHGPAVMTSLRPAGPLDLPPGEAAQPAHRADVEAIDVLLSDVHRLTTISQLLPHGRHCACPRTTCQPAARLPKRRATTTTRRAA